MSTEPKTIKLANGGTAARWMQDGDHKRVGKIFGAFDTKCCDCGREMMDHGTLHGSGPQQVCPGDWIVEFPDGRDFTRIDDRTFRAIHQVVDEDGVAASEAIAAAMRDAEPKLGPKWPEGMAERAREYVKGIHERFAVTDEMRGVRDEPVADTRPTVVAEFIADLPKPRTMEEAIAQRDAWVEVAGRHNDNEMFYLGIVTQIGEMFGDAAKTSDDGTVQQDVLALKVPDLVKMELEPVGGISDVARGVDPHVEPKSIADLPKPENIEHAIIQRNNWFESALYLERTGKFYHDIVIKIGEMFGDSAPATNGGSLQDRALAMKVPELVKMELELQAANNAEIERLNTELIKAGIDADKIAKDMADEYDRGIERLERDLRDSRQYVSRLTTQRDTWRVKADGYCQDLRRIQANESTKENPIRPVITFHLNGKVEGAPAGWSFINRAKAEHTAIVSGLEYKLSEVRRALDRLTAMVNE